MICNQCKNLGLKSEIYPGNGMSTCMGFIQYYDQEGNLHVHDPNTTRYDYRCSNGHTWVEETSMSHCPACGDEWTW